MLQPCIKCRYAVGTSVTMPSHVRPRAPLAPAVSVLSAVSSRRAVPPLSAIVKRIIVQLTGAGWIAPADGIIAGVGVLVRPTGLADGVFGNEARQLGIVVAGAIEVEVRLRIILAAG